MYAVETPDTTKYYTETKCRSHNPLAEDREVRRLEVCGAKYGNENCTQFSTTALSG
jgi:hypothetical protein